MKKMILSAVLVLTVVLTHAATNNVKTKMILQQESLPCTVTLKGSVDLGPIEAEVTCTTSAETCQEATVKAASCLKSAINLVRSILL